MAETVWTREFTPRDDGIHRSDSPGRWEWWYFDADLDNGYTVAGTFHFGSPRPPAYPDARFLEIALYDPEGNRRMIRKRYPKDQCSALEETCKVVIGPNVFEGEILKYHLYFSEGEVGADLTYESMVQGYGPVETGWGGSTMWWAASASRSKVSGTLTWDGQTMGVKGEGYHDHNWSDVPMSESTGAENAFWGRLYIGDWTLNWQGGRMVRKMAYRPAGRLIAYKKDKIVAISDKGSGVGADFATSDTGIEYPQTITIVYDDPGLVEGEMKLKVTKVIEFMDLHSRFKPFQRWYAETFVGRPAYFRHRFDYDVDMTIVGERVTGKGCSWCEHHKMV